MLNKTILWLSCIILIVLIIFILCPMNHFDFLNIFKPRIFKDKKSCAYFDNNATTFVYSQPILNEILNWINSANPSNVLHNEGQAAKIYLDNARKIIAQDLNANPKDIYFTGTATEANNIILRGIIDRLRESKKPFTVITTQIEHPSVMSVFKDYEKKNDSLITVIYLPVVLDKSSVFYGSINPSDLQRVINESKTPVKLISIMYVNNETGAINDIKQCAKIAHYNKAFFHSDITQAIGKRIIDVNKYELDAATFSGHKFHAPKGIGCFYLRNKCPITDTESRFFCMSPYHAINQGEIGQEFHLRPGTENVAYAGAMANALIEVHQNRDSKNAELLRKKKYILSALKPYIIPILPANSIENTILAIVPKMQTCNKLFALNLSNNYGVCIGVSSACQSNNKSHVLTAYHINPKYHDKIIRLSLSDYTTEEEIKKLINAFQEIFKN